MIVLDSSVVIEWLLNSTAGRAVRQRIASSRSTLHAPHMLDLEVLQVFRRLLHAQRLELARAELALEALRQLDITRYPHDVLLPRIWALRGNLTAYDAAYVALAEALDATLLTGDRRLANAPGIHARIEVIA